jgi:tetratricopeptide (TPR) repeat protein
VAAERWLRHGLELLPEGDSGKARFLAALGRAAWERFRAARQTERPEPELIRHLTDARRNFERAIEHESQGEYARLARHNLLYGHISYSLGDIDAALPHYRESIRYDRLTGNNFSAAKTRFNLAIALRDVGRLGEARKYAVAAFGELKSLHGPITDDLLDRSRRLVMSIELRIEEKRQRRQKRARRAVSVG